MFLFDAEKKNIKIKEFSEKYYAVIEKQGNYFQGKIPGFDSAFVKMEVSFESCVLSLEKMLKRRIESYLKDGMPLPTPQEKQALMQQYVSAQIVALKIK